MPARAILAAIVLCMLGAPLHGQTPDVIYWRQPVFRIPFQVEPGEQARLREVQLHLSEDQGRNWRLHSSVGADQRSFAFKAEREGVYWFTVRTVDLDGRAHPASLEGIKPGLRVVVDTQPPTATLRALASRQDQVGIEWELRDDNLDVQSLNVEYRAQGSGAWLPLVIDKQTSGQKYWTPPSRNPLEVRLRVQDRAENQATAQLSLTASGTAVSSQETRTDGSSRPQNLVPAGPNAKVVNTTKISLNYTLEEVGPSGVSVVELWYTLDGRSWQRYGEDTDKTPPFVMEVNGEGTYGLAMVVRSGVGLGDRPPQLGDPAQMWIEVDLTKPVVHLATAEAGRGSDAGNLTITWNASDKNLIPNPITLLYAEKPEGPWSPIAKDLENTGRYVWRVPPTAPYRFLVRIEALDRGGNIGRADSPKPVVIDLSQPKGRLLGVDASPKPP